MDYEFVIPGRLPGMNEFIAAQRANRYKGASMKKRAQEQVRTALKMQLKSVKISDPVRIHYIFRELNQRRDLDNISGFAHKVIQDALVEYGVLKDDGWKEIVGFTDTFTIDQKNPHILVLIEIVGGKEDG